MAPSNAVIQEEQDVVAERALEAVERRPRREADYIARNRRMWNQWAAEYVARGRTGWEQEDLGWGLWNIRESELNLLRDCAETADVVELGCGTAAVCAWLARRGMRPVGIDFSAEQLRTAERLQQEFRVPFPLVYGNVEDVQYDNDSFDVAVSEYGASLWCDPRRWLPEAHRLLRPDGLLVFFTNSSFLMACTPYDGGAATDVLVRDYFAPYRVEFPGQESVEFHLTHGHWIRLLRAVGFVVENLVEVRPPRDATPRFEFVSLEWARRWPSEEIWIARKSS